MRTRRRRRKDELVYQYRGKLYIFQNVPAGVCQQCGEKYLTAKVAKEIEQRILTKEKWDKTISVPVDAFPRRNSGLRRKNQKAYAEKFKYSENQFYTEETK